MSKQQQSVDLESFKDNARLRLVFSDLQSVLADFVLKHDVTPREFQQAVTTATKLVESGELPLAALTLFSFSVAVGAEGRAYLNPEKDGATPWLPVGPAYVPGAPVLELPYELPMRAGEPGEPLFVRGQVRSTDGTPVANAELDIWMTNNAGDYSGLKPEQLAPLVLELDESLPTYNLRGKFRTDHEGRYEYRTVMPGLENLGIPPGGPLDHLYEALGMVEVRPLHIHTILTADGFHTLTTQSHFRGDQALGNTSEPKSTPDVTVFATQRHSEPDELADRGLKEEFYTMEIDYVIRPSYTS